MSNKQGGDYEGMLLLEDMESLAEEMDEVGVSSSEEVRRWLASPRTDEQLGVPSAADELAIKSILDLVTAPPGKPGGF